MQNISGKQVGEEMTTICDCVTVSYTSTVLWDESIGMPRAGGADRRAEPMYHCNMSTNLEIGQQQCCGIVCIQFKLRANKTIQDLNCAFRQISMRLKKNCRSIAAVPQTQAPPTQPPPSVVRYTKRPTICVALDAAPRARTVPRTSRKRRVRNGDFHDGQFHLPDVTRSCPWSRGLVHSRRQWHIQQRRPVDRPFPNPWHNIQRESKKTRHQTLSHNFTNYYPIFNFFTIRLGSNFATSSCFNIPPPFKNVATLPCEIWMSENDIILKYVLQLMMNHKVV